MSAAETLAALDDDICQALEVFANQIVATSYEHDLKDMFAFMVSANIAQGRQALELAEHMIDTRRGRC